MAMCLSEKTRADRLAIAYQSNFVCLLRVSEVLTKTMGPQQAKGEESEVEYIDEGYHSGRVVDKEIDALKPYTTSMDMDIATQRPLLITCCKDDSTLRLWNYSTLECEMVKCLTLQHTSGPPEPVRPLAIAFHPSGYMIAGGFDSQAIIWHLLLDELRQFYVFTHYRHCTKLRFSNGGHLLAIAQMVPAQKFVYIHHTYTLEKLHTIKIPSAAMVCDIVFSPDDVLVAVCCTEGCVIVYDTVNRIETMNHVRYKNVYTSCHINGKDDIVAFGADDSRKGIIRRIVRDEITEKVVMDEDKIMHGVFFNSEYFFAGTEAGLVKLFDYPFGNKEYATLNMHNGPVTKLRVSPNGKFAFSCGEDGVVFVYSVGSKNEKGQFEERRVEESAANVTINEALAGVVLVNKKDVQKERKQVRHLTDKVKDMEHEMVTKEKSVTEMWHENAKELEAEKRRALAELESRISTLKEELSKKEQQYAEAMKKLDANHMASVGDLETIFKAKLDRERKNYLNLEQNMKEMVQELREEVERKEREKEKELMEEHARYEHDLERLNKKIREVRDTQSNAEKRYEDKLTLQEDEHDREMDKRELDLNKEINGLNETIKKKDDEINRLETYAKEMKEKNQDLQLRVQGLYVQVDDLNGQIAKLQSDLDKAQNERESTLAEMRDLKSMVTKLKSKQREGAKDKQVLVDLTKGLKDKVSPLMEENTELKKSVKGIEDEYYQYIKILEKQKKTIEHQLAVVAQQRTLLDEKDGKIKELETQLGRVSHIIYNFREKVIASKQDYAELVKTLYENFVAGREEQFHKPPELLDEYDRQVKYLQESKISLERLSGMKEQHLEGTCKTLRGENSRLLSDLNKALSDLQSAKSTIHDLKRECSTVKIAAKEKQKMERSVSLSVKLSRIRDCSVPAATERSSIPDLTPMTSVKHSIVLELRKSKRSHQRKSVQGDSESLGANDGPERE